MASDTNCMLPPLSVQQLLQLIGGYLKGQVAAVTPVLTVVENGATSTVGEGAKSLAAILRTGTGTVSDGTTTSSYSAGEFLNVPVPLGATLAAGLVFTAAAASKWEVWTTE